MCHGIEIHLIFRVPFWSIFTHNNNNENMGMFRMCYVYSPWSTPVCNIFPFIYVISLVNFSRLKWSETEPLNVVSFAVESFNTLEMLIYLRTLR